jgi:DNA mismatch repair protein MutS2
LSREQRDLETVLVELRAQLVAAEERATQAAEARDEAEGLRADLEARVAALAAETAALRTEARRQVRAEVREAERLVQRTRREVEAARLEQAAADLERARAAAQALPPEPEPPPVAVGPAGPIVVAPGYQVWLRGIASAGEALGAPDESGEFELQLGSLRTRVRVQQVERSAPPGAAPPPRPTFTPAPLPWDLPDEIEVRGQTLLEALPKVESFLDQAARAGKPRVFLIHGKGTGVMRRAVRDLLDKHPLVTRYESAARHDGGEGVTVAFLAGVR